MLSSSKLVSSTRLHNCSVSLHPCIVSFTAHGICDNAVLHASDSRTGISDSRAYAVRAHAWLCRMLDQLASVFLMGQCNCSQHLEEQQHKVEAAEHAEEDSDDQAEARKPFTRTMQRQERDALQKWTQCSKCEKWRKVNAFTWYTRSCLVSSVAHISLLNLEAAAQYQLAGLRV